MIKQFGRLFSGINGPICARALKSKIQHKLYLRGHHERPVMRVI
jgi:hypothetical protein